MAWVSVQEDVDEQGQPVGIKKFGYDVPEDDQLEGGPKMFE